MYQIKSDIPLPPLRGGGVSKYPFGDMTGGDSFRVAAKDAKLVRAAASSFQKKHGGKFAIRQYQGDYRCWKVE